MLTAQTGVTGQLLLPYHSLHKAGCGFLYWIVEKDAILGCWIRFTMFLFIKFYKNWDC